MRPRASGPPISSLALVTRLARATGSTGGVTVAVAAGGAVRLAVGVLGNAVAVGAGTVTVGTCVAVTLGASVGGPVGEALGFTTALAVAVAGAVETVVWLSPHAAKTAGR